MGKKELKQEHPAKSNNTQNIFFIAIIGILLVLVAYFFGKSQTPTTLDSNTSPTIFSTPSPTDTPTPEPIKNTFNTQACINNADYVDQSCINSCTNQANIQLQNCPKDNVDNLRNCGNSIELWHQSCLDDCLSTAKIAINNCRLGISP